MIPQAKSTLIRSIAVFSAILLVAACSSSPQSRFYLLKAMDTSPSLVNSDFEGSILIGPVELPDYIKREEIVFRNDSHRVTVADYDRWAEPLDRHITTLISANLATQFGTSKVIDYYSNFTSIPDTTIRIRITEFNPSPNNEVELSAAWEVSRRESGDPTVFSKSITVPIAGSDVVSAVEAMNQALNRLSINISESLTQEAAI